MAQKELFFDKLHGSGNDFIVVDATQQSVNLNVEQIRWLCDRHLGIGADGLIVIKPSWEADFQMIYYNSDGFEGSMCGNGGRTVTAYAFKRGIAGRSCRFLAYDGKHQGEVLAVNDTEFMISITMKEVDVQFCSDAYLLVNTGSPHYVSRVDNLAALDVVSQGRLIRHDKTLSDKGLNVNFLKIDNNAIQLRTYERGVEDETLSCGTGVTAAAIAVSMWQGGENHQIHTLGGLLGVQFKRTDMHFTDIVLTGPVKYVFGGKINL